MIIIIFASSIIYPFSVYSEVDIPVKAKIRVLWRYIPVDMNPLDIKEGFPHSGIVTASKSPFGGGGIKGKQIISLIKKKSGAIAISRCRALYLKDGEDPAYGPTLASIVIRNDNSLYDNYVITAKNGALALYVDVLVTK
ncbi:MAG: hypothetical protein KA369_19440 [Spirochaetes bacterium]|nr:hypothetical protein [Spirochaetota bacterium]